MIGYDAVPRYAEQGRRQFGAEDILPPGVLLEVDRVEGQLLKDEYLGSGRADLAALAANFSIIQVFNPVGSQRIVTVFNAFAQAAAGQLVFVGFSSIALTTLTANAFMLDRRTISFLGAAFRGMTQLRTQQQAAVPADETLYKEIANGLGVPQVPLRSVLAPGTGIHLRQSVVNVAMSGGFEFYERQARPEELAS